MNNQLLDLITRIATEEQVDPASAVAMVMSESSGQPQGWHGTPNHSGYGYMGLTPGTAHDMGTDFMTDEGNIRGGIRYLKQAQQAFPNDPLRQAGYYKHGPGFMQNNPDPTQWSQDRLAGPQNYVNKLNHPMIQPQPQPQPQPQQPPAQVAVNQIPNVKEGTEEMPIANEAFKKAIDEMTWLPDWAKNYLKATGPAKGGASQVAGYSKAGLAGMENNSPLPFDARQDQGQQLQGLMGLLLSDKLGGARSRKRVL